MRKCHASANFAPFMRLWCEISSVLPTPHEIFSFVFFFNVNSFLILVISHSQALLFKDYKRGGNHLSKYILYILHLVKFSSREEIQSSILLSFSLFYFLFLGSQTTSKDVFPEDERLNLWFLGVKEAR